MSISFKGLSKYFAGKIRKVYFNRETDINFIDAELVTGKNTSYLENCIYVGKTSMFKGSLDKIRNASFILINDDDAILENYTSKGLEIIEINENEDILEIYNEVRAFFRKDEKYNEFKIALLEIFLSGEGLNKIINSASKLVGNPIVVLDLSYKILASSPIENITDLLWLDNVKKGYCSYEFISELTKLKIIKNGRETNRPFEVTCPASPNKKIVYKVDVQGKTVGNIILIECEKEIEPEEYDYLILISEIISKELQKQQFYKNTRNVLSEEILYDLLANNNENKTIIRERLKNGSLVFSNHISVLLIDISNFQLKQSVYDRYLNSSLMNLFPMSNSIYYNGDIVIINHREQFLESEEKIEKIKNYLLENNLKMGISSEFSSIEDCSIYYNQAISSLEIGKILEPEQLIYKYEDIQPYNFIYMAKHKLIKEDFYNNSLYILKKYDKENGSDLYKTLYAYLKNNHSMTKTSEEMFIHRNTLRYRIEKIAEIIRVNLDENDNSFKLYYAYKSIDFYKKIINEQNKEK